MKALALAAALLAAVPAYAQNQEMKPPTPEEMQAMMEPGPEHGGVKEYDMVLRWVDADTYVSEIIFKFPTGPMKIAEMTFRRAK